MIMPTSRWFLLVLATVLATYTGAAAQKNGRSNLTIRQPGTEAVQVTVKTGSSVAAELFIEGRGEEITGSAVFLSFDDRYLELVPFAIAGATIRPFTPGNYLGGTVSRNDTLDDQIGNSGANGLPLFQMHYLENIPNTTGTQRAVVGNGILARFTLRVIQKPPGGVTTVQVDQVSPTGSQTGYFTKGDPGTAYRFNAIQEMRINITGLNLTVRLPDIHMLPGTVDSTLDLDDYINDPTTQDSSLTWTNGLASPDSIKVTTSPTNHVVTIDPRIIQGIDTTSFLGIATVPFTVSDGFGSTARDTIQVTVDTPPAFVDSLVADTIRFDEDTRDSSLVLRAVDVDPGAILSFSSPDTAAKTFASINDTGRVLFTTSPDYAGSETRRFIVTDQFGLRDTAQVRVIVNPINDPPVFLKPFNGVQVGALGQVTLTMPEYVRDVDDPFDELVFSFSGADSIAFDVSPGNQRMTITPVPPFLGTRTVRVVVSDTSGATVQQNITVSVLPPGDPQAPHVLVNAFPLRVVAGGNATSVLLDTLVTDLDTPVSSLIWTRSPVRLVNVDGTALAANRRLRVTATPDSVGYASMQMTVTDPTALRDSLTVRIYSASPVTGVPVVGGLPDITLAAGSSDTLRLDDYYFDATNTDAQMTWTVAGNQQVGVSIDAGDHQAVLSAPLSVTAANETVVFTVTDPDGNSASDTIQVTILDPDAVSVDLGVLVSGGTRTLTIGIPDTLDLSPALVVGNASRVEWGVLSRNPSQLFAQLLTRNTLLMVGLAIGESRVVITATDTVSGNSATDSLRVVIQNPGSSNNLVVRNIGALTLSTNQDTTISLRALVTSGSTSNLAWGASQNANINVEIDSLQQVVILRPVEGFLGNAGPIIFTARDLVTGSTAQSLASPITVTGNVSGNTGLLEVSLVVNPVRRNFLDAFVLSRRDLVAEPFMGFKIGLDPTTKSTALQVNEVARIGRTWVGDFVIADATRGTVVITATGITADTRIALTDTLLLQIADAGITSSFRIIHEDIDVSLPFGGVDARSKVAVFEESGQRRASRPVAQDGILQVSPAYTVYAPDARVVRTGTVRFRTDEALGRNLGIFRRDGGVWVPVNSRPGSGFVEGDFEAFGVYALFARTGAAEAALHPNFPNPFNPETTLIFDIGSDTQARLTIFNMLGQPVRHLVDGPMIPGRYRMVWDARDDAGRLVATGVYVTRLQTDTRIQMRKVLFLK